jgi:uncharacterized protein (TIGR02594 family)
MAVAVKEMGVTEIAGPQHNPRILEYFQACNASWVKDDETPWCGAFVGFVMRQCGYDLPDQPLRARDWLNWGKEISDPIPGCIVVFRRGSNPETGHVGFVQQISSDGKMLFVLGGNQGNRVCVEAFRTKDVLGYRIPDDYDPPGVGSLIKSSRIAKTARDVGIVGGVGAGTKVVETVTESPAPPPVNLPPAPKGVVQQVSEWQVVVEQVMNLVSFVSRNITFVIAVVCITAAARIVWARWQDQKTGKTRSF